MINRRVARSLFSESLFSPLVLDSAKMSARQRFEPQGKKGNTDEDSEKENKDEQGEKGGRKHTEAFKDLSNSPRAPGTGRNTVSSPNDGQKGTTRKNPMEQDVIVLDDSVTHKPLNISSLVQGKSKKSDGSVKKPRGSTVQTLKKAEQSALARVRSPCPRPMSPSTRLPAPVSSVSAAHSSSVLTTQMLENVDSRSPYARRLSHSDYAAPIDAHIGSQYPAPMSGAQPATDQQPRSVFQAQAGRISRQLDNEQYTPSLDAAAHNMLSSVPALDGGNAMEHLPPNRREIFPMAAAPHPAQHARNSAAGDGFEIHYRGERVYDFEVPLDDPGLDPRGLSRIDEGDERMHDIRLQDQKQLRRTTKRIGQHSIDDRLDEQRGSGKRPRVSDLNVCEESLRRFFSLNTSINRSASLRSTI